VPRKQHVKIGVATARPQWEPSWRSHPCLHTRRRAATAVRWWRHRIGGPRRELPACGQRAALTCSRTSRSPTRKRRPSWPLSSQPSRAEQAAKAARRRPEAAAEAADTDTDDVDEDVDTETTDDTGAARAGPLMSRPSTHDGAGHESD